MEEENIKMPKRTLKRVFNEAYLYNLKRRELADLNKKKIELIKKYKQKIDKNKTKKVKTKKNMALFIRIPTIFSLGKTAGRILRIM